MYKLLLFVSAITIFTFSSCGSGGDSSPSDSVKGDSRAMLVAQIEAEHQKLATSKNYDAQAALGALRLYTEFLRKYPNDTLTAEYLFIAADLSQGTGNYQQAAEFFETILAKHTNFPKYDAALFAAALLYDEHLENVNHGDDRAIQLYDLIIAKYPGTYYAEESALLKTYVGKPDSVFINDVMRKADSLEKLKK